MLRINPDERRSATFLLDVGRNRGEVFDTLRVLELEESQDQPANPVVAAPDIMFPENYNIVASRVAYDPGVDESEVRDNLGSMGDATVMPPQRTQSRVSSAAVHAEASAPGPSRRHVNHQRSDSRAKNREGPYPAASHHRKQSRADPAVDRAKAQPAALPNKAPSVTEMTPAQATDQNSKEPLSWMKKCYKELFEKSLTEWVTSEMEAILE